MPRLQRLVRSAFAGVAAITLLSSCSLINPHVRWDPPQPERAPSAIDLDYAIKYADQAKAAYKEALGNQSKLTSLLGLGLIPLGAAALGLGMTGGASAAVTALGLTGAAGFAGGTWLQSKPAQKAYIAGFNATSCAVEAVIPMLQVERDRPAITAAIDKLGARIADVESTAANVRLRLAQAKSAVQKSTTTGVDTLQALIEGAERQVTETEKLLASAYDTQAKAVKMLQEASAAGMSLKEAVDRISGQVSGVLVETGPDIQALAGIIGGLAQSYGQFVRVPEGLRPVATATQAQAGVERSPEETALAQALADLLKSTSALHGAIHDVANIVNAITVSKPLETLKACGVNPDQIVTPLTVHPPGAIVLRAQSPSTEGRTIRGGAAPYAVSQQGDSVEGLGVRQTEPFGPAFVVQSSAKTPAGQYTLYVSDKTGQRLFVPVEVKAVSGAGVPAAPVSTGSSAGTALAKAGEALTSGPVGDRTLELTDRARGIIERADGSGDRLILTVKLTDQSGGALPEAERAAITDAAIVEAAMLLKAIKNLGIPKESITIKRSP